MMTAEQLSAKARELREQEQRFLAMANQAAGGAAVYEIMARELARDEPAPPPGAEAENKGVTDDPADNSLRE